MRYPVQDVESSAATRMLLVYSTKTRLHRVSRLPDAFSDSLDVLSHSTEGFNTTVSRLVLVLAMR